MMISNKRGFTLIELLVVVLIIGVLAAVALPQYKTAVNKSRYAGLMPLAKSVKDAEEEVFMTKADYTADLGDLAVTPGTIDADHTDTATHGNVTLNVVAGAEAGQDYVKAVDGRNPDNTFVMYFARSPKYAGEIHCEAKIANTKAQQLCKSYGPINTVTGTDETFTTYVLQGSGTDAGALGSGGGQGNNEQSGTQEKNILTHTTNGCVHSYGGSTCVGYTRYDDETYSEEFESVSGKQYIFYDKNGNILMKVQQSSTGKTIQDRSSQKEYDSILGQETNHNTLYTFDTQGNLTLWKDNLYVNEIGTYPYISVSYNQTSGVVNGIGVYTKDCAAGGICQASYDNESHLWAHSGFTQDEVDALTTNVQSNWSNYGKTDVPLQSTMIQKYCSFDPASSICQ